MLPILLWRLSTRVRVFLRATMPSNILLDRLRERQNLRWGVPAMLVGVAYMYAAAICTTILGRGGPGILNLLVLTFIWSGMKILWFGPWSLILLARARDTEATQRRNHHASRPSVGTPGLSAMPGVQTATGTGIMA